MGNTSSNISMNKIYYIFLLQNLRIWRIESNILTYMTHIFRYVSKISINEGI